MSDQLPPEKKDAESDRRPVGRPRQLSLDQILATASKIGLNDLTLQAVADALKVTTPALYRHVQSREDLIAKVAAAVTGRFPVPLHDGEPWKDWAERYAYALLELYGSSPGLADYSLRRTPTSPPVLERHETSIWAAKRSGFDEVSALYSTRAVIEFVAGWVARTERRQAVQREHGIHPDDEFRDAVQRLNDGYPHLLHAIQVAPDLGSLDRFEFTLKSLLTGLQDVMSQRAAKEPTSE